MWSLSFLTEKDFTELVQATIQKYSEKFESFDLKKFNNNLVDPVKLIFDKTVYHSTWDEVVKNEIYRQRDKSNNNDIGYFHQNFFSYIEGCSVPTSGWDVIYQNKNGIVLPDGETVHTIYVEMKNKHNTMNSSSAAKTYIKMQDQLLSDDDCACFLVEAIAKKSQNIKWEASIEGRKVQHKRIRRVSLDQFYSTVTGVDDAFYQICMVLPSIVKKVVDSYAGSIVPQDTVLEELKELARHQVMDSDEMAFTMAVYLLGFSSYNGFQK